jgi:hypothetical protein
MFTLSFWMKPYSDKAKSEHTIAEAPNKPWSAPIVSFQGQAEASSTESSALPYSYLAAGAGVYDASAPHILGKGAWSEFSNGRQIFDLRLRATRSRFWPPESHSLPRWSCDAMDPRQVFSFSFLL